MNSQRKVLSVRLDAAIHVEGNRFTPDLLWCVEGSFSLFNCLIVNPMVVLLVQADVHEKYFVWKSLKSYGLTVLTAAHGEFALEASRNHPGAIHLLISDVKMPRMGGLDLCRKITAERPGIKVLMLSGDIREREQLSMNGFSVLHKPVTPAALGNSIETLIGPNSISAMTAT